MKQKFAYLSPAITMVLLTFLVAPPVAKTAGGKSRVMEGVFDYDGVLRMLEDDVDQKEMLRLFENSPTRFVFSQAQIKALNDKNVLPELVDALAKPSIRTVPRDVQNVGIILDCSASMLARLADGTMKMELAGKVAVEFVRRIPNGRNITFVVCGIEPKKKCEDIHVVMPLSELTDERKDTLATYVRTIVPLGKTPLARSLEVVGAELAKGKGKCMLVVISDGMDSCDGDFGAKTETLFKSLDLPALDLIALADAPDEIRPLATLARKLESQRTAREDALAAKKKADDEAALAKKMADEEAALAKKLDAEAAKKADDAALAKKMADEEAALAKKLDAEAAKKKADEAALAKKMADDDAALAKKLAAEAAKKKADDEQAVLEMEAARKLEADHDKNWQMQIKGLKTGKFDIALLWYNKNDLDLHVITPSGKQISLKNRKQDGGELYWDSNSTYFSATVRPVEHVVWDKNPPPGRYQVFVQHSQNFGKANCKDPTRFKMLITHDGKTESYTGQLTFNDVKKSEVFEFEVPKGAGDDTPSVLKGPTGVKEAGRILVKAQRLYKIEFTPDGKNILAPCDGGEVQSFEVSTGKFAGKLSIGEPGSLYHMALSGDGKFLVCSSLKVNPTNPIPTTKFIVLFNRETGKELAKHKINAGTSDRLPVAVSPDGKIIYYVNCANGAVSDLLGMEAVTGKKAAMLIPQPKGMLQCLALSPNAKLMALAGNEGEVIVYDLEKTRQLYSLKGHKDIVWNVAFSADSRQLASSSSDRTVRIWDLADGKQTHVLTKFRTSVSGAAFSPDGTRIATSGGNVPQFVPADKANFGEIKLWDIASESVLFETEGIVNAGCVAFSPLGDMFAAGTNAITLYRIEGEKGVKPPTDSAKPPDVKDKGDAKLADDAALAKKLAADAKKLADEIAAKNQKKDEPGQKTTVDLASLDKQGVELKLKTTPAQRALRMRNNRELSSGGKVQAGNYMTVNLLETLEFAEFTGVNWVKLTMNDAEFTELVNGKKVQSNRPAKAEFLKAVYKQQINTAGRVINTPASPLRIVDPMAKKDGESLHMQFTCSLQALNLAVPNRLVQPKETWKAAATIFASKGADTVSFQLSLTCTYEGSRVRLSKNEAVVTYTGKLKMSGMNGKPGIDTKERVSGVAVFDLDGGFFSKITILMASDVEVDGLPFVDELEFDLERTPVRAEGDKGLKPPTDPAAKPPVVKGKGDPDPAAKPPVVKGKGDPDPAAKPVENATTELRGHKSFCHDLAFSPNGKLLASASNDGTIRLWDLQTGKPVHVFNEGNAVLVNQTSLAFSPDGKRLVSGGWEKVLRLWDVASGKEVKTCPCESGVTVAVAFSPDGKTVAAAGLNKNLFLWNVETDEIVTLADKVGAIRAIAFSPDGKLLATGGSKSNKQGPEDVTLWDVATRAPLTILPHQGWIESVAFSPDGTRLACASADKTIILWNTTTSQQLLKLEGHAAVRAVAFSPDGKLLVSGGSDRTVKIWEADTGKLLSSQRQVNQVTCVAVGPRDNPCVAVCISDWVIRLTPLPNQAAPK